MKSSARFCYAVAVAATLSLSVVPAWAQGSHKQADQRSAQGFNDNNNNEGWSRVYRNSSENDLVPMSTVQGASVVDQHNKKIGVVQNIFVDPKTGQIARADIDFGVANGNIYSVAWNKVHLELEQKTNNQDKIIAKLDPSVVRRVEEAKKGQSK